LPDAVTAMPERVPASSTRATAAVTFVRRHGSDASGVPSVSVLPSQCNRIPNGPKNQQSSHAKQEPAVIAVTPGTVLAPDTLVSVSCGIGSGCQVALTPS
jgi:hypothetical protein